MNRDAWLQEYWGAQSKVVIRPSDDLKLTVAGDYFESDDDISITWKLDPGEVGSGGFEGPSGFRTTASDRSYAKQERWGLSFTAEANLGFADLTSVTAYRKTRINSDFDADAGPLSLVRIAFNSGTETFQQEFRLSSVDTEPFSWQTGVFYLHSEPENDSQFSGLAFSGAGVNRQKIDANIETNSYAVFGEGTYSITPTTQLTAGLRYTEDRRDFYGRQFAELLNGSMVPGGLVTVPGGDPLTTPGVQESQLKYDEVTWRIALRQEITDDINIYASINRGFKAGSYSLQTPLNDPYLPQTITAYEVGVKSELFDRMLRLNASVYHYVLDDYQVRSTAVGNPGATLMLNAATVEVNGFDLEFEAAPTANLRLFGGFTWLDSSFDEFGGPGATAQAPISYPIYQPGQNISNSCMPAGTGSRDPGLISGTSPIGGTISCFGDVSGNQTPNAPKFVGSFGMGYILPLKDGAEMRFSTLYSYNDGFYFEADNKVKQESYSLLNASVEYRPNNNVAIELWGRNLTDKEYAIQKVTSATGVTSTLAAPLTYGITLKYSY